MTGVEFTVADKEEWMGKLPLGSLLNIVKIMLEHYPDARIFPPDLPSLLTTDRDQRRMEDAENEARKRELDRLIAVEDRRLKREADGRARGTEEEQASNDPNRNKKARIDVTEDRSESEEAELDPDFDPRLTDEGELQDLDPRNRRASLSRGRSKRGANPATAISSLDSSILSQSQNPQQVPASYTRVPSSAGDHDATAKEIPPDEDYGSDGLPSYEEMIVNGLRQINDQHGSPPRLIFEWMNEWVFMKKIIHGRIRSRGEAVLIHLWKIFVRLQLKRCKKLTNVDDS